MDVGIAISTAWWTSIGISWSCIELPVAIEVSSFFDRGCKCGGLRGQKHHLLIEGAVEIVVEGKHLGNVIDVSTLGVLAPFLEPFIEFPVCHFAGMHLSDCLYLCLVRVGNPTSAQAGGYRSLLQCIAPLLPDPGKCWQRPSHTGRMILKPCDLVKG